MSWRYLKIADFCSTGSGGTPSKSKPEYYEGGDIPWIKSGDLKDSTIYDANDYITAAGLGRVRISTLRNENETFSQLNSITYIGVFLRLVTYSHLP